MYFSRCDWVVMRNDVVGGQCLIEGIGYCRIGYVDWKSASQRTGRRWWVILRCSSRDEQNRIKVIFTKTESRENLSVWCETTHEREKIVFAGMSHVASPKCHTYQSHMYI